MTPWRSVFLHEFRKGNLNNYHAVPGELAYVNSPVPNSFAGKHGYLVSPTRTMQFTFDQVFRNTIGVDITVIGTASIPMLLIFPPVSSSFVTIVSLAGGFVKLAISNMGPPDSCRVKFVIGGEELVLENIKIKGGFGNTTFKLRTRWYTNGQVHVWHNDALVAYSPGHAPGKSFMARNVALGDPLDTESTAPWFFFAEHFYVKMLREDDAAHELDKEIAINPGAVSPDDSCFDRIEKLQGPVVEKLRKFMSSIALQLTTQWRNTDSGHPFSGPSRDAHKAATEAFGAFIKYLRDGEQSQAELYLEKITEFFVILARTDPAGFSSLVDSIIKNNEINPDPACQKKLDYLRQTNSQVLDPVIALLEATQQAAIKAMEDNNA